MAGADLRLDHITTSSFLTLPYTMVWACDLHNQLLRISLRIHHQVSELRDIGNTLALLPSVLRSVHLLDGGTGWSRANGAIRQRIYSPPHPSSGIQYQGAW